ncbi:hypothetical protein MMC14_002754 [Varicellaria rhodocarpa]|nr:hypothetical protein [Varicellaria rhodocarpa]
MIVDEPATTAENNSTTASTSTTVVTSRPRRVRTGCLTCRERHLKCDEAVPTCLNCKKSNRPCKRGVRLNFIDTQVQDPPLLPPTHDWSVQFQDESRDIASEYKGGLGRYTVLEPDPGVDEEEDSQADTSTSIVGAPTMSHQPLPPIQSLPVDGMGQYHDVNHHMPDHNARDSRHHHSHSSTNSTYSTQTMPEPSHASYPTPDQHHPPQNETRDLLTSTEETLFMQVFVEEVGLWMDSMDAHKHFSRVLPFHALTNSMLRNALLACGSRHLTLINPRVYPEDKALHYYDTATTQLLKSLQNPNRDTVICATTAVILNVYEVMSVKALQRMNHIAGARALIKECGWSAKSSGIGAACFWLNVGMELLSCLHFNWQVAWNPDDWGVDLDFTQETRPGQEELWTYRIVYITAKVANFRASIPRFQDANPAAQQMRLQARCDEWNRLKDWCDTWNGSIPRTMHPMAYLFPYQTSSKSAFPEVWIIKRTTVVARLFYHTAMCLLPQIHPMLSISEVQEMHEMQMSHSRQICGIVAHVKDRGVASVALRCLAIAAECLNVRREQEEVLTMFEKIQHETGWRVDFLRPELKKKWGWDAEENFQQPPQQPQMPPAVMSTQPMYDFYQQQTTSLPPAPTIPPVPAIPRGIVNPLMRTADFNAPTHPYQNYYVAPSQHHHNNHYLY